MDFWDLTKLLVRRWMIVLPMLLLTGALCVVPVTQVKPDYVAMAFVQLVPPIAKQANPGQITIDQRNPWVGLGLQTLGNAAIVMVSDQKVVAELKDSGDTGSFTLTMNDRSPLVTFQVVGKSKEQASDTAKHLVDRFRDSVVSLQTAYGVADPDLITTARLDLGTNVNKSNSKVKRALIAAAGAGLLLTVAVTVGIDALLARRRRRKAAEPVPDPAAGPDPEPADPEPADPESVADPDPDRADADPVT